MRLLGAFRGPPPAGIDPVGPSSGFDRLPAHALRSKLFLLLLIVLCGLACVPKGENETTVGTHGGVAFLLRNHSEETVCYVFLSPTGQDTWGGDRLGPTEVVLPGGGRDWDLAPGHYDLRLQDCNRRDLMVRENVEVADEGVVLTFRARE